jgi:prepilin-type N-terminal cleavage/methylation domain-containing protein
MKPKNECPALRNGHRVKNRVPAFTLVELLVVLAIIGILAAMLLPSLAAAKRSAQGAQCVNNNHQMVLAWALYAQDNRDLLPSNEDGVDGLGIFTNWVAGTMHNKRDATNAALLVDPTQSLLARYVSAAKIYKCPGDVTANVRSYSMNCRMQPTRPGGVPPSWVGGLGTNYATFTRLSPIQKPDQMMVILDERSDTINDPLFAIDMSNTGAFSGEGTSKPYYIIDYPASYHNKSARVSFADNHVETHVWVETTTMPSVGQARPGTWTGPNDADTAWLQQHSTYRR